MLPWMWIDRKENNFIKQKTCLATVSFLKQSSLSASLLRTSLNSELSEITLLRKLFFFSERSRSRGSSCVISSPAGFFLPIVVVVVINIQMLILPPIDHPKWRSNKSKCYLLLFFVTRVEFLLGGTCLDIHVAMQNQKLSITTIYYLHHTIIYQMQKLN